MPRRKHRQRQVAHPPPLMMRAQQHDESTMSPVASETHATAQRTPAQLLYMQRQMGNRYVQRYLASQSPTIQRNSPEEDQAIQEMIDMLMAFEELAGYRVPVAELHPPEVTMPGGVAAQYRPALQQLAKAKNYRHGAGMKTVNETVIEKTQQAGLSGILMLLFNAEDMKNQELLHRFQIAKTSWSMARPTIQKTLNAFAQTPGASASYVSELRDKMASLDTEMTEMIPELVMKLSESGGLNLMEAMDEYQKAKDTADNLGVMLQGLDQFDALMGAMKPEELGDGALINGKGEVTFDRPANITKIYDEGMKNLKILRTITETPTKWIEHVKSFHDPKATTAGKVKAVNDFMNDGLKVVKDAAVPLIDYAGKLCGYMADKIEFSANVADDAYLPLAKHLRGLSENLPNVAKQLGEYLGPITGVFDIVSGVTGFIDGIQKNDFEKTATSVIGVGEGIAAVAEGASVAFGSGSLAGLGTAVAPFALSAKGMVVTITETSRMLQSIRNASVREELTEVRDEMDKAVIAATRFDTAFTQYAFLHNNQDPVQQALGRKFAKKAVAEVVDIHNALGRAVHPFVRGKLAKDGDIAGAFHDAWGGDVMASVQFLMDLSRPKDLNDFGTMVIHANELKDVMTDIATAVSAASKRAAGLVEAVKDPVKIWDD